MKHRILRLFLTFVAVLWACLGMGRAVGQPVNPLNVSFGAVLGNFALPSAVTQPLSQGVGVPVGGTLAQMPLGLFFSQRGQGRDTENLSRTVTGETLFPSHFTLGQAPFFANHIPQESIRSFFAQAYGVNSQNPLRGAPVGTIAPLRNLLQDALGQTLYRTLRVDELPIREVVSVLGHLPQLQQAISGRLNAATLVQLGLQAVPIKEFVNFAWKSTFGEVPNLLNLPFLRVFAQVPDIPVPVPVSLVNTGIGNLRNTSRTLYTNSFTCPEGGRTAGLVAEQPGLRSGADARLEFLFLPKEMNRRVGVVGAGTTCPDPAARGPLGGITQYKGRPVFRIARFTAGIFEIELQGGVNVALDQISFEGLMKVAATGQFAYLGSTANGAFRSGITIPLIRLNQTGVIFVPLQDILSMLQSIAPTAPQYFSPR